MKKKAYPTTVSGLCAKRAELLAHLKQLEAERRSVLSGLGHVDAVLSLFVVPDFQLGRYDTYVSGNQSQFRTFIAGFLKSAEKPVTAGHAAREWVAVRKVDDNELTYRRASNRIQHYFRKLETYGMIERVGKKRCSILWELVNELPHG